MRYILRIKKKYIFGGGSPNISNKKLFGWGIQPECSLLSPPFFVVVIIMWRRLFKYFSFQNSWSRDCSPFSTDPIHRPPFDSFIHDYSQCQSITTDTNITDTNYHIGLQVMILTAIDVPWMGRDMEQGIPPKHIQITVRKKRFDIDIFLLLFLFQNAYEMRWISMSEAGLFAIFKFK